MIIKRTRGVSAVKALAYDYGPGRRQEHHNPRRVAGSVAGRDWHARARAMQTKLRADGDIVPAGEAAAARARLKAERERAREEGRPVRRGRAGAHGRVIRLAVSAAPEDRIMSDREWATIATRVVREFTGDEHGYAWEAVRHDPRHIHLTLLARGHDGRLLSERHDLRRLGRISGGLERDLGLREIDHSPDLTPERKASRAAGRQQAARTQRETRGRRPITERSRGQAAPAREPSREDRLAAARERAERNAAERQAQRQRDRERGDRDRDRER